MLTDASPAELGDRVPLGEVEASVSMVNAASAEAGSPESSAPDDDELPEDAVDVNAGGSG